MLVTQQTVYDVTNVRASYGRVVVSVGIWTTLHLQPEEARILAADLGAAADVLADEIAPAVTE